MATQLLLMFEVTRKRLVLSLDNPDSFVLPELHQEDSPEIEVQAVRQVRFRSRPFFERLALTDVQVSVGPAASVLASVSAWTVVNQYQYRGVLPLNTAGINALADNAETNLEVRFFASGYYRGIFPVRVRKSVALAGALQTVAGDTALGALQASRIYMKKVGSPGEGFILTSADGTKQVFEYLHDDGSRRGEPIT